MAARGAARRGEGFGRAEACGFRAREADALRWAGVVRLAVPRRGVARAAVFLGGLFFFVAMDHILDRQD
ncbi:MAG: hypothetical protein NTY23_14550 [Chloroflexi bacterium]|nr:hypothetical protein [Chloroflexota bacterium]